jgi:hypothetical protein
MMLVSKCIKKMIILMKIIELFCEIPCLVTIVS